jgi:hypothetical protein
MGSNLNHFFVTFKILKNGEQIHEMECPRSMIQSMMNMWKYPDSPYTVHVVDHTSNFRFNSDAMNVMDFSKIS